MTRKFKKELAKKIMSEVENGYDDYSQTLDMPIEELIGIEAQEPSGGIRTLPEMTDYIENFHSDNLFYFDNRKKPYPKGQKPNSDVVQIPVNECLNQPAPNQELLIMITVISSRCRLFMMVLKKRLISERTANAPSI